MATWSIISGNLPNGLTLNYTTGKITGVATESGNFFFTAKVENDCGEDEKEINIFVCIKTEITSDNEIHFIMGEYDFVQLTSSGTPGTWSIDEEDELPDGLTLNSETGVIDGIPTVAGVFVVIVKIKTVCAVTTQEVTIHIESGGMCIEPEITTVDPFYFMIGEEDSKQIEFTGSSPQI